MRTPLPVLLALALGSCGSTAPRPDLPQPTAENDVFRITVHRVIANDTHVRVWATLENKTDQALRVEYGDFQLVHEGTTYECALRVPFVRITKPFPMTPHMKKRLPDALEALAVPPRGNATLKLTRYAVEPGEAQPTDLSVEIPLLDDYDWR